jgi:pimeloyl-ACP methyl ester carboxylesterase
MRTWLKDMREAPRAPRPLASMQEAVERLVLRHPHVPREVIESRARHLTRLDDQGRLIWAYDPLHRTTSPVPFNIEAFRVFLARIECPTLVVSGGPAGWHPADEAQRIALLQRATTFELPDAGHMMHWTAPGPLAARLSAFFGDPPPPRASASRSQ